MIGVVIVTSLKFPIGRPDEGPRVKGPLKVTLSLNTVSLLNVGSEATPNVTGAAKLTLPVKLKSCPVKELVKKVTVMLDVVEFSSLIIRTSFGVILVTAGSSLTFILAMRKTYYFSSLFRVKREFILSPMYHK